jgi:hypothetical protein
MRKTDLLHDDFCLNAPAGTDFPVLPQFEAELPT